MKPSWIWQLPAKGGLSLFRRFFRFRSLVSANARAYPRKGLFHAVLEIGGRVHHHFPPSCCDWASPRPPNVETRPLTKLAVRKSGDDGSTGLLASARNASITAAGSAGRGALDRRPSS